MLSRHSRAALLMLFTLIGALLCGCVRAEWTSSPSGEGMFSAELVSNSRREFALSTPETAGNCVTPGSLTAPANCPPHMPENPAPASGAGDVPVNADLSWMAVDPDGDRMTYDVLMSRRDGMLVDACEGSPYPICDPPGNLEYGKDYQWQVIVRDAGGAEVVGPVWEFNTEPEPLRLLLGDDFSTDLGWLDNSAGLVQWDPVSQWLEWEVERERLAAYSFPIDARGERIELSFRAMVLSAGGNGAVYFGLAETPVGAELPAGCYLKIEWSANGPAQVVSPHIIYGDGTVQTLSFAPNCADVRCADPDDYLDLESRGMWHPIHLSVSEGSWTASIVNDDGTIRDSMSGEMLGGHEAYRYVVLFSTRDGGWEWASGLLDDVEVRGVSLR